MPNDQFTIEVLEDGTIKVDTGKVSMPNHLAAENFLREMAKLTGGPVTRKHKHGGVGHSHTHEHGQEHHH